MKVDSVLSRLYVSLIVSLIIDWNGSISQFSFALAESINKKSSAREAVRKRKLLETEKPQNSKECMKDCSLGCLHEHQVCFAELCPADGQFDNECISVCGVKEYTCGKNCELKCY